MDAVLLLLATPFIIIVVIILSPLLGKFLFPPLISFSHPIPEMFNGRFCTDSIGMVIPFAASVNRQRVAILSFGIGQFLKFVMDVPEGFIRRGHFSMIGSVH